MAQEADAVVVGSALVAAVARNLDAQGRATNGLVPAVLGVVEALAEGVRRPCGWIRFLWRDPGLVGA